MNFKTHFPNRFKLVWSLLMSDRSLDRLALVSKIMLDERVIALRKENELLRLQLFWKDHCDSQLKILMEQANQSGPNCSCLACGACGRMDLESRQIRPMDSTCKFKRWFENILASCDMTCVTGVFKGMEPAGQHMSCVRGDCPYDVDAHFHHLAHEDWVSWIYGAKLWKAQSVNDPELLKLKRLFEVLETEAYGPDE